MKSLIEKLNTKLNAQGGFLKAVSVLVGGTALAQGIAILVLPILTRLYTPEEFSLFAVFTSLVMTISVASCLRFEIAIPIPQEEKVAVNLMVLAIISNGIVSLLIFLLILGFHSQFITFLHQSNFENLLWLVPISIFLLGVYNIFQYWNTRKKNFTLIAKTRMLQSISGASSQTLMGVMGFSAFGLILGQIIKFSAGTLRLILNFYKESDYLLKNVTFSTLKESFRKYQKFPKYSTLEALSNAAGIQIPIILIASLVGGAEAGFMMLAMQVMALPIAFIGNAVSQVYLAHASDKFQTGELKNYTFDCIVKLLKIGVLPLCIISLASPYIFPILFGKEWGRAGEMIILMTPWFIMQLLVSPISMSLHILSMQKIALLLQIIGLIIRLLGVYIISFIAPDYIFGYYAFSGFLFYLIFFVTIVFVIDYSEKNIVK